MIDIASIFAPIKEALAAGPTPGLWQRSGVRRKLGGEDCVAVGPDSFALAFLPIGRRVNEQAGAIADASYIATCNPERMCALIAAIEALQAERDALRDSLATEISRSCASERDCIWQPHCAWASKCLRPERPFDAALSAQTTKEA